MNIKSKDALEVFRKEALMPIEITHTRQYPICSGLYFLTVNDVVLYIGSSKNLRSRIPSNKLYLSFKKIDGFKLYILPYKFDGYKLIERDFIYYFKPIANKNCLKQLIKF